MLAPVLYKSSSSSGLDLPKINQVEINTDAQLDELIKKLTNSCSDKYIFRGQPEQHFRLLPKAYRNWRNSEEFKEYCRAVNNHNKSSSHEKIFDKWFNDFKEDIFLHVCSAPEANVLNLFDIIIFLLQYDWNLYKYLSSNRERSCSKNKERLELLDYKGQHKEYYLGGSGFKHVAEFIIQCVIVITGVDGKTIKEGKIWEESTAFEEALSQHYGACTALLDWTYNFKVALYFAHKGEDVKNSRMALFSLSKFPDNPNNLIKLDENKCDCCHNERQEKQKGLFLSFTKPLYYYYCFGKFPAVEDIANRGLLPKGTELDKYSISKKLLPNIKKFLTEEKISEETLGFEKLECK